jgi:quaternary ammonium compound-resistance protein SugE
MNWFYLLLAGIAEVIWVIGLKSSDGLSKVIPAIIILVFMTVSVYFLALAVRTIPIGVSYAAWSAIGIIGSFIIGVFFFGEKTNTQSIIFLIMILIGIVGLKITTPE